MERLLTSSTTPAVSPSYDANWEQTGQAVRGSLPFKFWNKKPWDWTFKKQLFLANKLIKKYSEIIVVRAVNSEEFKKNYPNADMYLAITEFIYKEFSHMEGIEMKTYWSG